VKPTRPRVIHVITRLIVGGAQRTVLELASALVDEFDVEIVCGPDEGPEGSLRAAVAEVAPVTVVPALRRDIRPFDDLRAVRQLRHVLEQRQVDVVHTHSSKAGIIGRRASPRTARLVHTIHGWGHTPADSAPRRWLFVALERRAAVRSDALVAVSEDTRDEGLRLGIGRADQYRVIPAGLVDFGLPAGGWAGARARARTELGIAPAAEIIGWVGRFSDQKDPPTLVRALEQTLLARPEATAVLVGDGPRRREAEARLRESAARDRVQFTGLRPDARRLMPAFDVLLHPSRWEGQPLVVKEALAERVPVVATRVSGVNELLGDRRLGAIVAVGDAAGMAEAAVSILEDPRRRAPVAEEAVAVVAERFGHDRVIAGHRELYREMVGRR
jgi:glycosyltransferase involved in cell wall biosynthesis